MGLRKPGKLLRDYRWVYTHDARQDKTPGRKVLRKLMRDNGPRFMDQMGKLESELLGLNEKAEVRESLVAAKEEVVTKGDAGTERALELVDKLLNEWDTSRGNG